MLSHKSHVPYFVQALSSTSRFRGIAERTISPTLPNASTVRFPPSASRLPPPALTMVSARAPTAPTRRGAPAPGGWAHAPSTVTLAWLAFSLPVVAWDIGYVLGRPATMPGGWAHWPLWAPYKWYGEVDGMYGFKAWNARNGFTAAQTVLNVVETAMYAVYLALWMRHGRVRAAGRKYVTGREGAIAPLLGFTAAVMTLSKTVLYFLNEVFSGFDSVRHNDWGTLIFPYCIMNGLWVLFPSILVYELGLDIIDGLSLAAAPPVKEN
ncbi:hypothetical protein P8C59_008462 [Phyllachora maydis]|uniref:Uncharacterized protein n=1 Tax=Phyllachora maydis TaxID=1825666 RepID=A0AAD9IAH5_9PEZI|nr:hypothetical protein P8C59_008462 [Phyllachora maydis]